MQSSPGTEPRRLRVAFNGTPLLSAVTGIGNYIIEQGAALARSGRVDPYTFYRYRWVAGSPAPSHAAADAAQPLVNLVKRFVPFRGPMRHAAKYLGFRQGLRRHRIQIYHEQNYVPLGYDVPVVVTVHDLSWVRFPDSHPADRVRWLERGLPRALHEAAAILVDSDFVRREVHETFGVPMSRLHTAHLGVSRHFRPREAADTMTTLAPLGLSHGRYVLSVATIEPRKNLAHLLEAFVALPAALREQYPLVVAGAPGWHSDALVARLRKLADAGHVRFLGQVSDAALCQLYSGAAAFAFPSIYEGFGLPPLEAMASGTPVIVSDRASMPEVVGSAGRLIDPEDPTTTTEALAELLESPALRAAMTRRGLSRASRFSWSACAAVADGVYRAILNEPPSLVPAGMAGPASVI